jgi:hypothetical protein
LGEGKSASGEGDCGLRGKLTCLSGGLTGVGGRLDCPSGRDNEGTLWVN